VVTNPIAYRQCDADNDGQAIFDLSTSNTVLMDQLLGPNQSVSDFTVSYYLSAADAQSGANALATNYQNISNPQDIYIRVVNNQTGCVNATGLINLSVAAGATASQVILPAICDDVNDGTSGTDGIITIDLTQYDDELLGTQDPLLFEVTYFSSLSDALSGSNPIVSASNYLTSTASVYAVVTNNATLCRSTPSKIDIVVEQLASVAIIGDHSICVDFQTQQILSAPTLSVDPSSVSIADYSFEWFLDGVSVGVGASYTITDADAQGAYTVVATSNVLGCVSAPSPAHQVVKSGPAVAVGAGYLVSNPFADVQTITLTIDGYGAPFYGFQLDNGPIVDNGGVFTGVTPGEHTVTIYDLEGEGPHCDPTVLTGIFVADYPTFFTPNGDGYNDTWNIVWPGSVASPKIFIFDRYGKLLKQISSAGQGWDGTYNGEPMPSTDYWFLVEYKDPVSGGDKEFKAHFSLKR
jgi:gliding motility-associated-like protein